MTYRCGQKILLKCYIRYCPTYTRFLYEKLETTSSFRSFLIFNPMLVLKVSSEFLGWNTTLGNFSKKKCRYSY